MNVEPVDPAMNTTLSNCLNGRIREYGPSISTDRPELLVEFCPLGYDFSAYLKNLFVAPFLARTTNSILPSEGMLDIVNGCDERGATTWQARKRCCPASHLTGGSEMVTRVWLSSKGSNVALHAKNPELLGWKTARLLYARYTTRTKRSKAQNANGIHSHT